MSFNEAAQQTQENSDPAAPRLRVNRTVAIDLTTTPQRINFNGTSDYNLNSYPVMPGATNPSVWYDPATSLFKFGNNTDKNYSLFLSVAITANTLLSTLNLTSATLRARLYIPASPAVTFPLPDGGGYIDITPVNITGQQNKQVVIPFFSNQQICDYGFGIDIWLSNAILGTVKLTATDCSIYKAR